MPRGGKRNGAGRPFVKLSVSDRHTVNKATAEDILASVPEREYWQDLIEAEMQVVVGKEPNKQVITIVDKRLRMEALKYLTDKRDGKAPQAITAPDGGIPTFRVLIEHIGTAHTPTAEAK